MNNLIRAWSTPFALLVLCLVSFGLLIPWLGFYWDDWPVIYLARLGEAARFWEFYAFDRPFSAWTYLLTVPLLGTHPLPWHIFTLLLRWLTAAGMWWSLVGLWPHRRTQVTWMALLFTIYPVFTQQSIAVAYSQHWISYALYFLSIGAMIKAWRTPRWFWPLTALALLSSGLHLFTMEYFLGLELLRPAILWLLAGEQFTRSKTRAPVTLIRWSPYLALLLAFILWRVFFLELAAEDPNRLVLLANLVSMPVATLASTLQTVAQDSLYLLFAAWYQTLVPAEINLSQPFFLYSTLIASASALVLAVLLLRARTGESAQSQDFEAWLKQALILGALAILFGLLPMWLAGRQVIVGLYGSRFGLAATFGASIFIVGLLEWLTPHRLQKVILLSILVGLATGFHLRTANQYRWIWRQQAQFYWQLAWRAPHLEAGTAILSENELFPYVGAYSTSIALNLAYPFPSHPGRMSYWFFDLYDTFGRQLDGLEAGAGLGYTFRSFNFRGSGRDSLVIYYTPAEGRCLWVLAPGETENPELPQLTTEALSVSNLDRIHSAPLAAAFPPESVFGPEPAHTWCYYYQKAELARQSRDWQSILELGDEAQRLGYAPSNRQEWLPFVEANAYSGHWEKAMEISLRAFNGEHLVPRGCRLWERFEAGTSPSPERDTSIARVRASLACPDP